MMAFIFPGQGSQVVGMGKAMAEAFPEARDVFEQVNDALHMNLSKLMFEGPLPELTLTQNAQPALLASSMAVLKVLESGGLSVTQARVVAGHSVGEYSALVATGVISLAQGAELLRLRGQAMADAVSPGEGAMAALLGMSLEQVEALPQTPGQTWVIANDNAPGQIVISGHREAVENAVAAAKTSGGKGMMLNVSGPFHSPLMAKAGQVMEEVLEKETFLCPVVPVISNWSATPSDEGLVLKAHLIRQLTGRVRWRETMETLSDLGIDIVGEVGTGSVLCGLAKRGLPEVRALRLETPQDVEAFARGAL